MMLKRKFSKFLCFILRHHPEAVHIELDEHGYVEISQLIDHVNRYTEYRVDVDILDQIVQSDQKQRYSYDDTSTYIRCNHGHTVPVDLQLSPVEPPDILYHGTAEQFLNSILKEGILPKIRVYVHLSNDIKTAKNVGSRHGKPVVLRIDTKRMRLDGYLFYRSYNGIWLTDKIPVKYIGVCES